MKPSTNIATTTIPARYAVLMRSIIETPPVQCDASEQVRLGIADPLELSRAQAFDEQHLVAAREARFGIVGLHHDVKRLDVLGGHARLSRIARARSARDDGRDTADERFDRHRAGLVPRYD